MSYESAAEPINIGYLTDFLLSANYPWERRDDLTILFDSAAQSRRIVADPSRVRPGRQLDADGVNSHLVARFGEE